MAAPHLFFVNKKALANFDEFLKVVLPAQDNLLYGLARLNHVNNRLLSHKPANRVNFVLVRIQLIEGIN